jgi:protein-disulfide isomerase
LIAVRLATVLAGLVVVAPYPPIGGARAQSATAALLPKPMSLPDVALGPARAPVNIVEYASMTCLHCAAFAQNVFPMLRSKYIDTGKVHFVFREFPLDIKAAAASMLTRCIASDDAGKYFATIELLFKQQDHLMAQTKDTLKLIGKQAGMDEQAVEACEKDQTLLDKLSADQKLAFEVLKVDATPTLFLNGERLKGAMSFEERDLLLIGSPKACRRTTGSEDQTEVETLALSNPLGVATKVTPIRFRWIQVILHS